MNVATLRQRAVEALQQGDLEQALEAFTAALRLQPGEVELYHERAECCWTAYEFDRALATYEEAIRARPTSVATCLLAAKKLFGIARFTEAAHWLERARALAPDEAPLLAMQAEVYERGNRLGEAEHCAAAALDRDPGHVKSVRIMAHLERRQGKLEAACQRLRDHLARDSSPEQWMLRYELAALLDQLGHYRAALDELLTAKHQLREHALPALAEAQAIRRRQQDLARLFSRADFESWRSLLPIEGGPQSLAFLCGHPRSGTTLLEQILGRHERVVTTDETGVWVREFLRPLVREPASANEAAAELCALDRESIEAGRAAYLRFTEAHLGQPVGSRLLIEKDPALTPDLPLPLRLFPEARVIFPLRDPRDVCLSYFFTLVPLAASSAAALDWRSTCESCAHSLELWSHWKRVLPYPLLETRYESLVTDPDREIRRVLDFLQLPWMPSVLEFAERSRAKGIRTPTYADVTQPLYQRAIGRWKNYEAFLAPHLDLLQPHLRAFGYD